MQHLLQLAEYAYNNCEFARGIDYINQLHPTAEAEELRIKCLMELDQNKVASDIAGRGCVEFSSAGSLHYFYGIALYLSGADQNAIADAFERSLDIGFTEAYMGLGFLAFANRDYNKAIEFMTMARSENPEHECMRHLKILQVYIAAKNDDGAHAALKDARTCLEKHPSLLRKLWSDLCYVRLLRAEERFRDASEAGAILLSQLSAEKTPRLYRNLSLALQLVEKEISDHQVTIPEIRSENSERMQAITRKPILNSLLQCLKDKGRQGASKEDIVGAVWKESYNPLIHDDRIYKTVGRLRAIMGDSAEAPKYIVLCGCNYVLQNVGDVKS